MDKKYCLIDLFSASLKAKGPHCWHKYKVGVLKYSNARYAVQYIGDQASLPHVYLIYYLNIIFT
jgi:hypothetical protein